MIGYMFVTGVAFQVSSRGLNVVPVVTKAQMAERIHFSLASLDGLLHPQGDDLFHMSTSQDINIICR